MNNEYSNPNSGRPRTGSSGNGRYLNENAGTARPRRRRRRKLNPRFLILCGVCLVLLLAVIIGIASCAKPSLKGRWDLDGYTFYEFYEKGKGALVLMSGDYEFKYTTKDGVLYIDFIDDSKATDAQYDYKIQKDTLFLTGGPGDIRADYVLTRD